MYFKTSQEHEDFRAKVRAFAEKEVKPIAFLLDKENRFPEEAVKKMGEMGLMGLPYPKEYGGAGLDVISYAIAVEELSRVDEQGLFYRPMFHLAPGRFLLLEQKSRNRNIWYLWQKVKSWALSV